MQIGYYNKIKNDNEVIKTLTVFLFRCKVVVSIKIRVLLCSSMVPLQHTILRRNSEFRVRVRRL